MKKLSRRGLPVATIAVGLLTAAVSIVGFARPDVLQLLERHPTPSSASTVARLFTSLLVHDGWAALIFNLAGFAMVAAAVEQRMGVARWIACYLVGGIVGEVVGLWWQPVGAGNSVASFGLAGALIVATLYRGAPPVTFPVLYAVEWVLVYAGLELGGLRGAVIAGALCAPLTAVSARVRETAPRVLAAGLASGTLGLAVVLCFARDIHGPPLIAGMIVGLILRG